MGLLAYLVTGWFLNGLSYPFQPSYNLALFDSTGVQYRNVQQQLTACSTANAWRPLTAPRFFDQTRT